MKDEMFEPETLRESIQKSLNQSMERILNDLWQDETDNSKYDAPIVKDVRIEVRASQNRNMRMRQPAMIKVTTTYHSKTVCY